MRLLFQWSVKTDLYFASGLHLQVQALVDVTLSVGHVKEWLDVLGGEHSVLLPQVQHSDHLGRKYVEWRFHAVGLPWTSPLHCTCTGGRRWSGHSWQTWDTSVNNVMVGGSWSWPWSEDILVRSKLVSWLPHDGVYHVQSRYLVLWLTLLDKLLHALHHVFVELDGPDGALRDGRHLGLRGEGQEPRIKYRKSEKSIYPTTSQVHTFDMGGLAS